MVGIFFLLIFWFVFGRHDLAVGRGSSYILAGRGRVEAVVDVNPHSRPSVLWEFYWLNRIAHFLI